MNVIKRFVVPVLGTLLLAGCAGGANGNDMSTEATCVISGEPAGDGPTADFMGQTVHFCCDNCMKKWNKLDDAGKKAKLGN